MPYYRLVGDVPRKRHVAHHIAGADGSSVLAAEELMGTEGFSGASTLLYHRWSPSAIVSIEPAEGGPVERHENLPLRPHHLRTGSLSAGTSELLGNDDVRVGWSALTSSTQLVRDATGDQLVYVQSGAASLDSVFGRLPVGAGDYVVVPRSTTHRWSIADGGPVELLTITGNGHVAVPAKYRNEHGQLVEGAPFSERDLRGPSPEPLLEDGADVPVMVRTRAGWSVHVHARHPFDVVGWDGYLYPWALNILDFEPIVGRLHQPPPVHQTFAGNGFVICSFVPRLLDLDPEAIRTPYHHANVDSDEVLFYSSGDFTSRKGSGIGAGSISLHPAGFVHGPQPGAAARSRTATQTDEVAVMLDTFRPLCLTDAALAVSDPDYPWSWAGGR
jgi:homogentisate 1,2-dioxygenase